MSSTTERSAERNAARRTPLTRERVLQTAVDLADSGGIDALTIRRLAEQLGVEPMSLYYHVPNKEAILDGIVDLVFAEVEGATGGFDVPDADAAWKAALRTRILAARGVMLRHPWAPGVMDSRNGLGLTTARYVDSVVGTLRSGGFSYDLIHHSMHALGSRMFGFSQELGEEDGGDAAAVTRSSSRRWPPRCRTSPRCSRSCGTTTPTRRSDGATTSSSSSSGSTSCSTGSSAPGSASRARRARAVEAGFSRRAGVPPRAARSRRAPARSRRRPR